MPPHFPNFLSSQTLEIRSCDKTFIVHGGVLAEHSEPLRRVVIDNKKVDLSNWDSDTVGRFIHFLYVKDYKFPEATSENQRQPHEEENEKIKRETIEMLLSGIIPDEGGVLDSLLQSLEMDEMGNRSQRDASTPSTIQNLDVNERAPQDTSMNPLLVHAKLYALAQDKNIEVKALQLLALERLSTSLEVLGAYMLSESPRESKDVIELLSYAYSHTKTHTNSESMRGLVLSFVTEKFEVLVSWREMGLLLDKGGELVVELMEKVAGRVSNLSQKLCDTEKELRGWEEKSSLLEAHVQDLNEQLSALKIEIWKLKSVGSGSDDGDLSEINPGRFRKRARGQ